MGSLSMAQIPLFLVVGKETARTKELVQVTGMEQPQSQSTLNEWHAIDRQAATRR
jgi:hypothetical protein